MEKYSVPQFIEEEGKIIYFLTFKQFFWLLGGGALILVFYFIFPFWIFAIIAGIIALLIGAIAFVKIEGDSLLKILFNAVNFLGKTKKYIWKKKTAAGPFKIERHHETEDIMGSPALKAETGKLQEARKSIETSRNW